MFKTVFIPLITKRIDTNVMQKLLLKGVVEEPLELVFDIQNKQIPTLFNVEENQSTEQKYFVGSYDTHHTPHKFILKNEFVGQYIYTEFLLRGALEGAQILASSNILIEQEFENTIKMEYKSDLTLIIVLILITFISTTKGNQTKKFMPFFFIIIFTYFVNLIPNTGVNVSLHKDLTLTLEEFVFPIQPSYYNMSSLAESIPDLISHKPYNNYTCKICNFTSVPSDANSSPRDLIITCAINEVKNVETFVRSCRTSGCKATIVIISNLDLSREAQEVKDCGVNFVHTDYYGTSYEALTGARFKAVTTLLNLLPAGSFDRILYADLYDTIFQGDPFLSNITKNSIVFSDEDHVIRNSTWSMQYFWGTRMFGFPEVETLTMPTICSGLFVGDAEAVRFIFNTIGNWMPLDMMTAPFPDQIYFNVFVATHALERAGFDVWRSRAGEWLTSASINFPNFTKAYPSKRAGFDTVPVVMHHSNRIHDYYWGVQKLCNDESHTP